MNCINSFSKQTKWFYQQSEMCIGGKKFRKSVHGMQRKHNLCMNHSLLDCESLDHVS